MCCGELAIKLCLLHTSSQPSFQGQANRRSGWAAWNLLNREGVLAMPACAGKTAIVRRWDCSHNPINPYHHVICVPHNLYFSTSRSLDLSTILQAA